MNAQKAYIVGRLCIKTNSDIENLQHWDPNWTAEWCIGVIVNYGLQLQQSDNQNDNDGDDKQQIMHHEIHDNLRCDNRLLVSFPSLLFFSCLHFLLMSKLSLYLHMSGNSNAQMIFVLAPVLSFYVLKLQFLCSLFNKRMLSKIKITSIFENCLLSDFSFLVNYLSVKRHLHSSSLIKSHWKCLSKFSLVLLLCQCTSIC